MQNKELYLRCLTFLVETDYGNCIPKNWFDLSCEDRIKFIEDNEWTSIGYRHPESTLVYLEDRAIALEIFVEEEIELSKKGE